MKRENRIRRSGRGADPLIALEILETVITGEEAIA